MMTIETPNEAPDDTPKIYGLTRGFLKTDCKTAPDIARLEPTKETKTILGNRMDDKITSCSFVHKILFVNLSLQHSQFRIVPMSIL